MLRETLPNLVDNPKDNLESETKKDIISILLNVDKKIIDKLLNSLDKLSKIIENKIKK
ncbi:MAG: hypothetical protein ACO2O4_00800 [Minisyncoccia bacterium]|jgi:hypothetical protein